jgi:putative transposase
MGVEALRTSARRRKPRVEIKRAFRYELDLNNEQRTACLKHAGAARWAYNFGLRRKKEAYAAGEKTPTAVDLHRELNVLKQTEISWMYEVSKCAPQEALRNLDRAFVNFFSKRSRFPRFKSRKRGIGSFRLTGSIYVNGKTVQLPRLGLLRLKEESAVTGKILSATVSERAGRWFVSLQVETSIVVPDNQGPSVGVDLGIKTLATLSDGRVFENPKSYRRKLQVLKRAQRIVSRRQKGSKRRERAKRRVAKLHYRIANIRSDAIHKMTTFIAATYGMVGIEDLNVSGMTKNHCLAGAVSDAAFGEIRRQLTYKCQWYGSELVVHDRFMPSSKTCSECGEVKDSLLLSDRTFCCEGCGHEQDRDLNAAINLRPPVRRFLRTEAGALAVGKPTAKLRPMKCEPNAVKNR